jgi:hypothetical protein
MEAVFAGQHGGLDAVEFQLLEPMAQDGGDCLGHQALAPVAACQVIADGRYHDVHIFGLTRSDWAANTRGRCYRSRITQFFEDHSKESQAVPTRVHPLVLALNSASPTVADTNRSS